MMATRARANTMSQSWSSAKRSRPWACFGTLRDELLDRKLFLSLPEARVVLNQ